MQDSGRCTNKDCVHYYRHNEPFEYNPCEECTRYSAKNSAIKDRYFVVLNRAVQESIVQELMRDNKKES